ncbi:restriction endonuclease subunit S [Vibrio diabolicus]|uniref:restriction endonuclease subunit S n=1 Tax=Vibrio diabolicus TaxID=50719 RepID=UPI00216104F3|nr:restriction endonuclease subunit S [Vibrio diabolicus]MCS0397898.1 restriction endonuclease subunit S [Vibrio diabolicus]
MNNRNKGVVPALRFPEFDNMEGWRLAPLKKLASRRTERNRDGELSLVLTNSAEHGVVNQRDYFDKDIANQGKLENYFVVNKGDYVYNPRISAFAPVGPISKNTVGNGVMSPLYTVFRFKHSDSDFYTHYFKSSAWHSYMRQVGSTGARHDRMAITNNDFMAMPLPVPPLEEQRKIANCLSSLDDLIVVHTKKHEALQSYKKGLMQNLFPINGDTLPSLRLPEFTTKSEWESIQFGKCVSKSFYGTSKSTSEMGLYPVLRMGNMANGKIDITNLVYIDLEDGEFSKIRLNRGDILFNRTNSPDLVGKVSIFEFDEDFITASYIVTFRLNTNVLLPEFANQLLNTGYYQSLIKGLATRAVSQANINPSRLKEELIICIPKLPEQKKIADCLSSVDEIIAEQSYKVNKLKSHKKGLMQQLFSVKDKEGK